MRTIQIILLFLCPVISFSQQSNDITGSWKAIEPADNNSSMKVEFQENGEIVIQDYISENGESEVVEGYYYYENGDDLLVTITWYGDEAKTTMYTFNFEKGNLIMKETYPDERTIIYERDQKIVEATP